ncbi:MAG: hypothetical protein EAS48_06735, partial [Chryseobacterium sp.]
GSINYLNLLSYNFYIYLLAIAVILYILFRHVTVAPKASRIHMLNLTESEYILLFLMNGEN